jgi:hypothetical protein
MLPSTDVTGMKRGLELALRSGKVAWKRTRSPMVLMRKCFWSSEILNEEAGAQ